MLLLQVTTVQASSLSQVIAIELLKKWGDEGFFKHIGEIKDFYQKRRDDMVAAADKHLTGNS